MICGPRIPCEGAGHVGYTYHSMGPLEIVMCQMCGERFEVAPADYGQVPPHDRIDILGAVE